MLHDEILDLEYFFNNFKILKNQPAGQLWAQSASFALASKPHAFYFDRNDIDQNIIDTAHEFYKEGILDFPYPECTFVFKNAIHDDQQEPQIPAGRYEIYHIRKINQIENPALMKNINESIKRIFSPNGFESDYVFMKFTPLNIPGRGKMVIPDPFVGFLGNPQSHNEFGTISAQPIMDISQFSSEDLNQIRKNYTLSIGTLLGAMMLLNTKYAEKKEHKIDAPLNASRKKRGKPPLNDFTVVSLDAVITETHDKGTHASPKPHWRRGHIRRLPNKNIPIAPCLINWDGSEVATKKYKVLP